MAKGIVIQFRQGRTTQRPRHFLILPDGSDSREKAKGFVGKKVKWKSPAGKIIEGEIRSAHGNKGVVRAIFNPGLPGQAISEEVEIS